jgi:hypothetical protein
VTLPTFAVGVVFVLVVAVAVRLTIAVALTAARRTDAKAFWPTVRHRFVHGGPPDERR